MDKRIVIIDGNSLINRAYYAMQRPMITKDGIYTQGIFGFINMLNKINNDYEPEYIAVTFDRKAPTFRHLEYDEYKAGRKKMPPELVMQMPLLKDVLAAMNIKCLEMDGYEADDLIGTISREAEEKGLKPLIITGDKDALQLASDKTHVLITKKGISEFDLYDYDAMMEKYGLTPEQFIDLKGLMGDSSDNIPGIPGVGEKTALKLLHEYGSVEMVLESIDEMPKSKLKEKIRDNQHLAVMSKRLATINRHVPIELDFEEFLKSEYNYEALVEIYTKLEFNSFLKRLDIPDSSMLQDTDDEINEDEYPVRIIKNIDELGSITGDIYIRVITDASHTGCPEIDGIGILTEKECIYIEGSLAEGIADILNCSDVRLCGHDIKNDIYSLMFYGLEGADVAFDSAIAQYVLDPSKSNYELKTLVFEYLHKDLPDEKEALSGAGQISLFDDNSEVYSKYLRTWLVHSKALREKQEAKLKETELEAVLNDIELPLIEVLASMEKEGIYCSSDILKNIGTEIGSEIDRLTSHIHELAGEEFNINSPAQLGTILFEKLGLPAGKKTKKGYSTSADVLEKIKDEHEIVPEVLEYRTLTKLKGTYVDGLLPLIGSDGRIHAHFQQTVAATGRLSCTEPNLQNIPVRTELGRSIRKAFVSKDGSIFTGADYSQIELRVLAHMSGDERLIEAFNSGADIHKTTASQVLGIPEDEITPAQRSSAKAVNFGVIYGMSGFGLSTELNISRGEAEKYIADYFTKYEAVKTFMDSQIEFAREKGYVMTYTGRRRYINEISASNYMTRQLGERLAMNSPIQGSAADIIKVAMVKVYRALKEQNLKSRLVLQIHDELIIEAADDEIEIVKTLLEENMTGAAQFKVKLIAEVNTSCDWYSLK